MADVLISATSRETRVELWRELLFYDTTRVKYSVVRKTATNVYCSRQQTSISVLACRLAAWQLYQGITHCVVRTYTGLNSQEKVNHILD